MICKIFLRVERIKTSYVILLKMWRVVTYWKGCVWTEKASVKCTVSLSISTAPLVYHSLYHYYRVRHRKPWHSPSKEADCFRLDGTLLVMGSLISELNLSAGKTYWLTFQSFGWIYIFDNKCWLLGLHNSHLFPFPLTRTSFLYVFFNFLFCIGV